MQAGASSATAPARHLRTTRKQSSAEERLKELGIQLPSPPTPFGSYAEAVRSGNLLFLSGMLPTEGHTAKFVGRAGAEFDVETVRQAARLAALNGLAVAREYLGSLDKITRIVRLGVSLATTEIAATTPRSPTVLRTYYKTFLVKIRARAASSTGSPVCLSAYRSRSN